MSDTNDIGTLAFWLSHVHADWATNENEYGFRPVSKEGISVGAFKHTDKKIEIRLSGPFSKSFRFITEIPDCGPKGLFVVLRWINGKVTLSLNNREIETKDEASPLIEWTGQAFSSATDEATRTLELAIAFDISGSVLMESLIARAHFIPNLPPMLVPPVVCDAFSIELYLKFLYQSDHKSGTWGHDINKIFSELDAATQEKIREEYSALMSKGGMAPIHPSTGVAMTFDDVLREAAKAFENWRYIYELNANKGDQLYAASGIRKAIKAVARERCPQAFAFEQPTSTPPTSPPP